MPKGKRGDRLNEQFKREIAEILRFEVKDPRVGSIVVTGAKVAPDLSLATIYVMIPDAESEPETLAGLQTATPFIRSQLGRRLTLRKLPNLRFLRDESLQYATRINKLLHEVEASQRENGAEGDATATE